MITQKQSPYIIDYISGKKRKNTPEEVVRQEFLKKLHKEYGYPKDRIDTGFPIQRGSKGKRSEEADIVIFNSTNKKQNNIFLIVETKSPSVSTFDYQLSSYVTATTAIWCIWTNGKITYHYKTNIGTKDVTKFSEVWDIPHYKQRLGAPEKTDLVPPENLTNLFQVLHDWIYANSNIKKPDRVTTNIINILFCKIFDELSFEQHCKFYVVLDKNDKPDIDATHKNLFALFKEVKNGYNDIFYKGDTIEFNKKTILYLVSKLQKFSFMNSEVDAIGTGFEVFSSESLKSDYGQFFTPREVIKLMVGILEPQPNEFLIDPACGSGGFLIESLFRIRDTLNQQFKGKIPDDKLSELKRKTYTKTFFGVDQERDLAKISKAYMAIVGDGSGGIFAEDSLILPKEWESVNRAELKLGNFDVVFTNPPFGKDIKVRGKLLEQYDLAKNWKNNSKSVITKNKNKIKSAVRPSVLFIERCIQFLKKSDTSRMGIILPVGDLSNDEDLYIKEWLLNNTKIFAVIQLPTETFQPYTGTQTCLLFLQPINNHKYDHQVFMAQAEKIGKDKRGKPIYLRNKQGGIILDKNENKIIDNNLVTILDEYSCFTKGNKIKNKFSFLVNGNKLRESLLPNFHNPDNAYKIKKGTQKEKIKYDILDNLCERVYSPPRTKRIYVEKQFGIPFLSGNNITQSIPQFVKYVSRTETKNLDEYIVHEGDIVTTRVGTMGIVRLIGKDLDGYAVSDNINIIKVDKKEISPEYLYAILYSELGRKVVKKVSKGSVQHYNTPTAIKNINIPILSEPEYSQIVDSVKTSEIHRVEAVDGIFDAEEILETFLHYR